MRNDREKQIYKVTIMGGVVNFALVVFKFMAGILGHSSAMIADAVHSVSDFITDIVVLVFVKIAGKPADSDHQYGHGKFETLASIIVGVLLMLVGVGLAADGIEKTVAFFRGESLPMPGMLALAAAAVSIISKEILYRYTILYGRRLESPALVANAWHHRSDALTSIAALVGIAGAMLLGEKWIVLDPLAAVVVSVFIVKAAWDLMKPGIDELLEKSLPEAEQSEIEKLILSTAGVNAIHRLRTRRIGDRRAIEVHIKMDGNLSLRDAHDVATAVESRLRERFGAATHVAIHMEPV